MDKVLEFRLKDKARKMQDAYLDEDFQLYNRISSEIKRELNLNGFSDCQHNLNMLGANKMNDRKPGVNGYIRKS